MALTAKSSYDCSKRARPRSVRSRSWPVVPARTPCRPGTRAIPCQHVACLLECVEVFAYTRSSDVQSLCQFSRGRRTVDEQAARTPRVHRSTAFHNSIVA